MTNSMLRAVQHFYPNTWDQDVDYESRRYQLIDLPKHSPEYRNIESNFRGCRVQQVKRIQNPYTFGPYLLRMEQLQHQNEIVNEKTMYHAVMSTDLFTALEFNIDTRRYGSYKKHPELYANPQQAINVLSENVYNMYVIVCKVIINSHNVNTGVVVSQRDTERLPQYVVKLM